jgi:RND family efflux transporter MFP subunit
VTTAKAEARDMAVNLRATGTVFPLASVDVKPQTSSVVTKMHINGGQFVRAGDPLFTLDGRAEEANLSKARAQLAKNQAALADTQRQLKRAQELLAQNFVAKSAVDTAQAAVDAASATLLADQAAIDAARVALSYTQITAPLSGRAGALSVSIGTALQANVSSTVTITQLDPIAVTFNLPQRNLAQAIAALKDGGAKVTATLADGGGSFKGRLYFVDNAVDAASGTVRARAKFDNKEARLWPGAFVEISQTLDTLKDAVVVPQAALIQTARGTIVYQVLDGKAVSRPVKQVGGQSGEAAVTGISAGDVVVVDGKQNLRPGSVVLERTKDAKPGAPAPDSAGAAAATAPAAPSSRSAP